LPGIPRWNFRKTSKKWSEPIKDRLTKKSLPGIPRWNFRKTSKKWELKVKSQLESSNQNS